MPEDLHATPLSTRDLLATTVPSVLRAIAVQSMPCWVRDPSPPRHPVLATGTEQGTCAAFGKRHVEPPKAEGSQVELRARQASAENLEPLREPSSGVGLAFVQGGAERAFGPDEDGDAGEGLSIRCGA